MPTPAPKLFQSIFTQYDGWDDNGPDSLMVYLAELAQNLEPFKKGDVVDALVVNMDTAQLELYYGDTTYLYSLTATFTTEFIPTPTPTLIEDEDEDEDEQGWDD
jgi:hypothetical protein